MNSIQIISILSSISILALTYLFDKWKEREAEWRKEKLKFYINFVESLSGITDFEKTPNNEKRFAKSCNDLHLLGSKRVISALHKYQESMALSNKYSTTEEKGILLTKLVIEMRKDIGLHKDDLKEIEVKLWTSGVN